MENTASGADGLTLQTTGDLVPISRPRSETSGSTTSAAENTPRRCSSLDYLSQRSPRTSQRSASTNYSSTSTTPNDAAVGAAKTLVHAAQTGTVSQIVITTYEDRIARQLAAADPTSVRIVHADKPSRT